MLTRVLFLLLALTCCEARTMAGRQMGGQMGARAGAGAPRKGISSVQMLLHPEPDILILDGCMVDLRPTQAAKEAEQTKARKEAREQIAQIRSTYFDLYEWNYLIG
jgi:hypothetical protein